MLSAALNTKWSIFPFWFWWFFFFLLFFPSILEGKIIQTIYTCSIALFVCVVLCTAHVMRKWKKENGFLLRTWLWIIFFSLLNNNKIVFCICGCCWFYYYCYFGLNFHLIDFVHRIHKNALILTINFRLNWFAKTYFFSFFFSSCWSKIRPVHGK